jgi:transcription elongation factor GreA
LAAISEDIERICGASGLAKFPLLAGIHCLGLQQTAILILIIFKGVTMKQYYFTEKGYEKLKTEIDNLERFIKKDIAKEIAAAREHGDLRENAEYEAAKGKQANYMAKLGQLQERFTNARVIRKEDLPPETITLGKKVKIKDVSSGSEITYIILGEGETDIDNGIISYQSPLAKSLINHRKGDKVEVILPRGTMTYEILDVDFFEA